MLSPPTSQAFDMFSAVRSVQPPGSPFDARIAESMDGRSVMLADRAAVADLPGWTAQDHAHLLAPVDIVRRSDGHDVVFPLLTESVTQFLQRREDAGAPVTGGEAVTLAVSIVRGLSASLERNECAEGEWWLTDDGRPLLVEGVGHETAREASARLLGTMAESLPRTRLGAVLSELADAARQADAARIDAECEDALFGCADPEPLLTEVLGPRRARHLATTSETGQATSERSLWQRLAFHMDADLADTASDAVHAIVRRIRRSPSRRRAIVIAVVIAGLIAAAGMLWPTDGADITPGAAPAQQSSAADAEGGVNPSGSSPDEPDPATGDIAAATTELLDRRLACGDIACLTRVLEDPARELPAGVIDHSPDDRRATLLDDLGGVVVVRLDSLSGRDTQIITVVDTKDGWRIRDVHDVTDAPSRASSEG
ncbi:hypothetical protein [Microbacterium sp. AG1240]|uniref:hypothetical protein n=1 Tax=Microbacterium sp. AG1240 TaxID=2183992 RepID=UPI000EAC4D38|nr:hypothetical protein [Microbacterium sp. AG1240]